ncbi:hypothetical protein STEG23_032554 [Scotinomys teguina]
MWYIYTMEYYTAEKSNDIMKFAGKWLELENVILIKVPVAAFITATKMLPCHQHEKEKFFVKAKGQVESALKTLHNLQNFGRKAHDIAVFKKQGRTTMTAIIATSVYFDVIMQAVSMMAYSGEELLSADTYPGVHDHLYMIVLVSPTLSTLTPEQLWEAVLDSV